MHQLLVQWVNYVLPWIEALGIIMVLWCVLEAVAYLAHYGWSLLTRRTARRDLSAIRVPMGEKLVLGLEFFLAGDIIQTIAVPSWDSLAILGGIVIVRTILVYFLNLERRQGAPECPFGFITMIEEARRP